MGQVAEQLGSEDAELRCPRNPSRLFARLRLRGEPVQIVEGNLIEVSCRDCRGRGTDRVLHRYNVLGELVETVRVPLG